MNPRDGKLRSTSKGRRGWLKGLAILAAILALGVLLTEAAPGAGDAAGLLLILGGAVGIVHPIARISLATRKFSTALRFVGLFLIGHSAVVEERALEPLKAADPDLYLSELRKLSEHRWRTEMEGMRPEEYAALIAEEEREAAQAAEEARRVAEEQREAAEEERRAAEAARLAQAEEERLNAEAQANLEAYEARLAEEEAMRPEREKKRKGFHCLSECDRSHRDFKQAVRGMMRKPGSFEHISTRVTPMNSEGMHLIFMDIGRATALAG